MKTYKRKLDFDNQNLDTRNKIQKSYVLNTDNTEINLPAAEPSDTYKKRQLFDISHRYGGRKKYHHYTSTRPVQTSPFLSYTKLLGSNLLSPRSVLLPGNKKYFK